MTSFHLQVAISSIDRIRLSWSVNAVDCWALPAVDIGHVVKVLSRWRLEVDKGSNGLSFVDFRFVCAFQLLSNRQMPEGKAA